MHQRLKRGTTTEYLPVAESRTATLYSFETGKNCVRTTHGEMRDGVDSLLSH
jgi:hypothetical protein